jgi:hypothetical protein
MKFVFLYFLLEKIKSFEIDSLNPPFNPIAEMNLNLTKEITSVVTEKCTNETCVFPYGYCATSKACQCHTGYTSLEEADKTPCRYEMKNQLYAFVIEVVFTFGLGHLYMNRYDFALGKFSLECLILVFYFIIKNKFPEIKFQYYNTGNFIMSVVYTILFAIFLSLHVYDLNMLSKNVFKDGNGVGVLAWDYYFQK